MVAPRRRMFISPILIASFLPSLPKNSDRDEQNELYECIQQVQDPRSLQHHVATMYRTNVSADLPRAEVDANVMHEYRRHRVRVGVGVSGLLMSSKNDCSALQDLVCFSLTCFTTIVVHLLNTAPPLKYEGVATSATTEIVE